MDAQLAAAKAAAPSAAEMAKRGQIKETAQSFEASFLTQMMQPMFEGLGEGPFGGGQGEQMFKGFLLEAMGKQMARSGGVGLASTVEREMLKLQGLTDLSQTGTPAL
nr:rod-binding protein [Caulobacter sp. NIBR2454]